MGKGEEEEVRPRNREHRNIMQHAWMMVAGWAGCMVAYELQEFTEWTEEFFFDILHDLTASLSLSPPPSSPLSSCMLSLPPLSFFTTYVCREREGKRTIYLQRRSLSQWGRRGEEMGRREEEEEEGGGEPSSLPA